MGRNRSKYNPNKQTKKRFPIFPVVFVAGLLAVGAYSLWQRAGELGTVNAQQAITTPDFAASQAALDQVIKEKRVVNTHEHMQDEGQLPQLLEMMDKMGIHKTILVGSSYFTLTMNDKVGFTRYDENNEEILRLAKLHPDRLEAWPTLNPQDPQKYEKIVDLHKRGASGVKLYTGHGYVRRDTGDYMFHPVAMDDPSMFPVYEYFEDHHVPICFHVNPFEPGFAQELVEVLKTFPDMKVICPHFVLSSIKDSRMREFLDTFPNLYSDISFGHDDFITAGIGRMSRSPEKFREIFEDYPDRFFFGSDLVLTVIDKKSVEWLCDRVQTYYDVLTKETFTSPVFSALPDAKLKDLGVQNKTLNGLGLRPELIRGILYENYEKFMALKPEGTKISREINWKNMGVDMMDRYPGQSFPPRPKK